jgi:hypothetical protein
MADRRGEGALLCRFARCIGLLRPDLEALNEYLTLHGLGLRLRLDLEHMLAVHSAAAY